MSPAGAEEMVPLWYWLKVIFVLAKTLPVTLKKLGKWWTTLFYMTI